MPRLFVALALPAPVREELARATGVLERRIDGARWVPRDNLHLTLAFLGHVDDERVATISAGVADAVRDHVDFDVRLGRLGAFPSVVRARVVWAGLEDGTHGLAGVAASVAEEMERIGFPRERRAFAPHVTLARLRAPRGVDLDEPLVPVPFLVDRIGLYESRLGRPNAVYTELAVFPFRRRS